MNNMSTNQKIILTIFIVYLALNAFIGILFSKRQGRKQHTSSEKKFFIGGRNMNGLLLAMTTMATYTSVSSFISGPGAAGLTYGYAGLDRRLTRFRSLSSFLVFLVTSLPWYLEEQGLLLLLAI